MQSSYNRVLLAVKAGATYSKRPCMAVHGSSDLKMLNSDSMSACMFVIKCNPSPVQALALKARHAQRSRA